MFFLLAASIMLFPPADAVAESDFFAQNCAACHNNDTVSCNACHAHGVWQDSRRQVMNLTATTDLDQYQLGQTVTVTFSGGYRDGWIRAILYDHTDTEIDRVTGPTGTGDDGTPSPSLEFPVFLSAPVPSEPGFYTWSVSWFGSPYDEGNPIAYPHVEETVLTNQFEVLSAACPDADQDGYEDEVCNPDPAGGGGDCDDSDPSVNPGQTEVPYNGIDDDCDPSTPDDDLDGDGFGIVDDCDDSDPTVNPDATEICDDGIDNNCDGLIDSEDPDCIASCPDADQDGYEDKACNPDPASGGGDCNDGDPLINPGQAEIPYNGIDDDCEPSTPDDDIDGDGYGLADDCNDNDPTVNPGAAEGCSDGIDNDCDGLIDSEDPDCGVVSCPDADQDGYEDGACNPNPANGGGDCDDGNPLINPGQAEIPYNGIDDDCKPFTPDDDLDGDGYGHADDCNDNDPLIHPGMSEICGNGIDNDCDGLIGADDPDCAAVGLDARVMRLMAPEKVEIEEEDAVRRVIGVLVRARGKRGETATGTLFLFKNDTLVDSVPVTLSASWFRRSIKRFFVVTLTPEDTPSCVWEATVEIPGDPNPSNNTAVKTTRVVCDDDEEDEHEKEEEEDHARVGIIGLWNRQ
jgi:hypothetical protein